MKRLLALALALCIMLAACGPGGSSTTGNENSAPSKENEKPIEITLPASLFSDSENFDPDAYAEEQGFLSAVQNEDGTVTIKMTKAKYQEELDEMENSLEEDFSELVKGEDTPYIEEITHNDNFSLVTVKVDREGYENAMDMTSFAIGLSVSFYQMFLEMEYRCQVDIVDSANGEVIKSTVYPDVFND